MTYMQKSDAVIILDFGCDQKNVSVGELINL